MDPGAAVASSRHPRDRLRPELSLQDAVFLVVASVVGSGIFLTPGLVADRLPHAGLIFGVWVIGALLSLAGALANAELGAMFPRAGGDYVYLSEAFHPAAGFMVGWLTFFAIFAGTVATLAAGFAVGLGSIFELGEATTVGIAIATVVASSALNAVSLRWGARVNNVTGWVKVGALLGFGLLAPFSGAGSLANLAPLVEGAASIATPAALALALSPILFSYLGWNASVYVASEIRDPARNLPRSLFLGIGLCAAVYLVMNAVYLYALPIAELRHTENAGEAAARALFGETGGRLLTGFVLVSILGTLHATILVGPRIPYAMALDGLFFRSVDQVHASFHTPVVAIALQALTASVLLLLLRTFPSALDFTTFTIVLATMADVAALYALRRRQPGRPRPYRAWGYPVIPGLYLLANALIALGLLTERPWECLVGLSVLVAGLPCYAFFARASRRG